MVAMLANSKIRHQVTILDTNESYTCFNDQHLLKGMVSLGKRGIPSGCHGGGCGVCKVKIVRGEVELLSMSRDHVSEEEEKAGVVLACRAFPKGDVALKVIGKLSKNVLRPSSKKKYGFV
ncbi:MAG: 2Fe-2S iron-sulfur cluster-binding protein [Sedimenticola sp.]